MKKVMFIIVGMLFAVTVNAASLNLTLAQTGGDLVSIVDPASGQLVAASDSYFQAANGAATFALDVEGRDTRGWFSGSFDDFTTKSYFKLFEDGLEIVSALIIGPDANNAGSFAFNLMLKEASIYVIEVLAGEGQSYDFRVETPIPAALFLFAPALLGFFGLRRKAAVAV